MGVELTQSPLFLVDFFIHMQYNILDILEGGSYERF